MKEKGPLQGHNGSSKGKSSDALPQETPNRKQKQNTQSATAGSKNKKNKETPTCHLEAQINLVEGSNGVNCLGICFSLSVSTSWNSLQESLTTIA